MKNLSLLSVSFLCLTFCLAIFFPVDVASQIVSAPGGGLWNSTTTWVGGIVPGAADNVVIESTVSVNGNACNDITIVGSGVLQNHSTTNYTLTVNGNLTNDGILTNNTSNKLHLNLFGNLTNNGSWTNGNLTFSGTANHDLASSQPMSITNVYKTLPGGRIKATSGLSFIGTNINLNDTIEFTTGNSITLSGAYISSGVLFKSALPALQINADNGSYANSLTIDAPLTELNGTLLIVGNNNNFKGHIVNYGTLQNNSPTNYTLTVTGDLTNYGIVQNNVNSFYLNISGNLANNGTWTNYSTTLNGNGNQELSMTQPFGGANLARNAGVGRAKAISGIAFIGTSITLNDTLEFTTGNSISMNGGSLTSGVLYKSALPALQMFADNGTYTNALTIDAPLTELNGTLLIVGNSNNFKGHIVNYGTLQNNSPTNYTLTITGSFTNNGIVKNNVNSFYLNISGNLTNHGTWINYSTTLNGNGNQELAMTQPFGGAILIRNAGAGKVIATTGISFTGTNITLNDTLEFTTGNSISMSGGSLNSGVLYKSSLPAIQITAGNGNLLYFLTIDSPQTELYGTVQIYGNSNLFKSNMVNFGSLQNRSITNYTLNVTGNFTNNGTIQDNINRFYLNISGNITNNGEWKNRETALTGSNTHIIAFTSRFEGESFINSNASGSIVTTTDLIFDGTTIDLNNCAVSLASGSRLSVLNGSLQEANISGSDIHFHSLGAYCHTVVFDSDVTLHGVFEAGSNVFFNGSIINEGVLRNRRITAYSVLVQGGIENNGSITNNLNNLTLTVLGDIHNNGIWSNYLTTLDGATDQNIFLINNQSITGEVRFDANFSGSGFVWWGPLGSLIGNAGFSGANTQILRFLTPVTDAHAGQYFCVNNSAVHSRNIFIQSQSNPVRMLTLNLLLEGLYNSNGLMNASRDAFGQPVWSADIADQITVELRDNGNFSNIVFAKEEVLLSTNGFITFAVSAAYSSSYYITIRHRSGIITVSAAPVSFTTPQINYNFDLANKAYGDNMVLMPGGYYAFFGGDVNQDGVVDTADMTPVDNGSAAYLSGYRNPDANGDGIIDTADMTLVDNNSSNYVSAATP
jgi:hypothetical protein